MIDPKSDRTEGYHLLIEPTGSIRIGLEEVINLVAQECGGPVFVPHITLLARITHLPEDEMIETSAALAKMLEPLTLTLGTIGMEDAYFRALYLHVRENESLSLAHARANEAFFMEDENAYTPHLSLLYGNYSEQQKRAASAALPVLDGTSFSVDSFSLYHTPGAVGSWKKIRDFTLGA